MRVPRGGILVVHGAPGGGKTSLLLTLAGRMEFTQGALEVAGRLLPDQRHGVRGATALAEIAGVNDLDPLLTVGDHLTERLAGRTWLPWVSSTDRDRAQRLLTDLLGYAVSAVPAAHASAGIGLATRVRELAPFERWVLGVTLALVDDPEILLVDDVDALRGPADRAAAWAVLVSLAGSPVSRFARGSAGRALTVIASCRDAGEARHTLAAVSADVRESGIPVVELPLSSRSGDPDMLLPDHSDDRWTDPITDLSDGLSEKVH